jgi:hypothetical protein
MRCRSIRRDIFNLALLGQYAANFSAGANGLGGALITDPPNTVTVFANPNIIRTVTI